MCPFARRSSASSFAHGADQNAPADWDSCCRVLPPLSNQACACLLSALSCVGLLFSAPRVLRVFLLLPLISIPKNGTAVVVALAAAVVVTQACHLSIAVRVQHTSPPCVSPRRDLMTTIRPLISYSSSKPTFCFGLRERAPANTPRSTLPNARSNRETPGHTLT